MKNRRFNSVGVQMFRTVMVVYLVVAMVTTLLLIYEEYTTSKEGVLRELNLFKKAFDHSLAQNFWTFDFERLESDAISMLEFPLITGVIISDHNDRVLFFRFEDERISPNRESGGPANSSFEKLKSQNLRFPVFLSDTNYDNGNNDDEILGYASLFATEGVAFSRIKWRVLFIILTVVVQFTALWLIFLQVSRRMITKPLTRLNSSLTGLDIERPTTVKLNLQVSGNNELSRLEKTFNQVGKRLFETHKERERARQLEREKEKAEAANRAKSIFLANMSHELRTPLNAILGFSSMLCHDDTATPAQKEKLAIINRSGEHLLSMINDILDLSKIEAGRIELKENPIDLLDFLKEIGVMIQSRAEEKGLSFVLESEAVGFSYVSVDAGKLRQILINLLGNAVKFTSEGGVTLRAATQPLPETPERCHVVVEVEDTGPGIDPARQERIFEPFVQEQGVSAQFGTGLGLSICETFTELMDGSIEVDSELGKGAMFRVRIPAGIAEEADIKAHESKPSVIGLALGQKALRILIVDDHPENRVLLKALLEKVGFSILEAENGKEALEVFENESPDFIWMDMRMPVMDGYEAARQIRRRPGGDKLPIVAITASAFRSQRPEILASGCDDMVFKPFREHEIFETMARFLEVKYVYEEPDDAAAPIDGSDLTADMIAELPTELIQELDKTTLVANREAILEVVERIAEHAPDMAVLLRSLVQNFEIERIRHLLAELG